MRQLCATAQLQPALKELHEPSTRGPGQGRYVEALLLEFSLSSRSFQGCRLMIGCRASEGTGSGGSTRFLAGVLGLDTVTRF